MAVTAIWPVRDNLKRVIRYASNLEKTEDEMKDLHGALNYISQSYKTEEKRYVTGINCSLDTAFDEMNATKKLYQKTDGILAFHAVQSFKPGEVTPEIAHEIGIKLAEKLWGDRFEVIVATHLDREHIHSHFVLNSVSFKDGKRYYDTKASYRKIRDTSDELCAEYGLSIIKTNGKGESYLTWMSDSIQKPTIRSIIIDDVELAIRTSKTSQQFYKNLESYGYKIKKGKHVSIKPPFTESDKYFRLYKLTKDGRYDEENIIERIINRPIVKSFPKPNKGPIRLHGDLKKARKLKGFKALYVKYMYMFGIIKPKNASNKRMHFLLKDELLHMDRFTEQVTYLAKNKIEEPKQLQSKKFSTKQKLDVYVKHRKTLYQKKQRCKTEQEKEQINREIEFYSSSIKDLRKEIKINEDIEKKIPVMKERIEKAQELQKQEELEKQQKKKVKGGFIR